MAGVLFFVIGAAAVILGLAGISLLTVWLQGRLGKRGHLPACCSGEPALERCRTCRYMQGMGDDGYCSLLSVEVQRTDEGHSDGGKTHEKIH